MRKEEVIRCPGDRDALLKFLLVKAAPVMMEVRPAVLVRLANCGRQKELQRYDQFCVYQKEILAALGTEYFIMKVNEENIHIMFFDRQKLKLLLRQPRVKEYLTKFGYPGMSSLEMYMNELRRRFNGPEFPHEIGIFLGYPLKDVRGFIEKRHAANHIRRTLWKIFGDPAESLRLMRVYRFAEDIARAAIEQYENIDLSIARIRKGMY